MAGHTPFLFVKSTTVLFIELFDAPKAAPWRVLRPVVRLAGRVCTRNLNIAHPTFIARNHRHRFTTHRAGHRQVLRRV